MGEYRSAEVWSKLHFAMQVGHALQGDNHENAAGWNHHSCGSRFSQRAVLSRNDDRRICKSSAGQQSAARHERRWSWPGAVAAPGRDLACLFSCHRVVDRSVVLGTVDAQKLGANSLLGGHRPVGYRRRRRNRRRLVSLNSPRDGRSSRPPPNRYPDFRLPKLSPRPRRLPPIVLSRTVVRIGQELTEIRNVLVGSDPQYSDSRA